MKVFFIMTMSLWLAACNSTLEDPDSVPIDDMLQLTSEKSSISTGGGRTKLFARIPKDAGMTDVTFTTTAGIFPQANDKTIKQYTDSLVGIYRYATIELVSDTTTGKVYITGEAKTARRRILIIFTK